MTRISGKQLLIRGDTNPGGVTASNLDKIGYIAPIASNDNVMTLPKYIGVNAMGSGSSLDILGNSFFGLGLGTERYIENGIFVDGNDCSLLIRQNTFSGLRTAIQFYQGVHTIERMECNTFDNNEANPNNTYSPKIGLLFGGRSESAPSLPAMQQDWGTAALTGPIGNDGINNSQNPSGNAWPIDPVRLAENPVTSGMAALLNWASPLNWVSLKNNNPDFNLEYWAYNNEFVRSSVSPNAFVKIRVSTPGITNPIFMFQHGIQPPTTNPNIEYVEQCNGSLPDVFPLFRMAVASEGSTTTNTVHLESKNGNHALLGDAVPNPATDKVIIPVFIPVNSKESYQLSIFSLDGKTNQFTQLINGKGSLQPQFSVLSLPAGVYGYNLSESGKIIGTRKLVVIK